MARRLRAWDAIATGYDGMWLPQETDLANDALRLVGVEPGERFLDVAAGTGSLGLPAARLTASPQSSNSSSPRRTALALRNRADARRGEARVRDAL